MILLTGVTGKTGGETARQLLARGARLRALVRNEAKAAGLKAAGLDWAMIKPNFFMQHLLTSAGTIKAQRKFFHDNVALFSA